MSVAGAHNSRPQSTTPWWSRRERRPYWSLALSAVLFAAGVSSLFLIVTPPEVEMPEQQHVLKQNPDGSISVVNDQGQGISDQDDASQDGEANLPAVVSTSPIAPITAAPSTTAQQNKRREPTTSTTVIIERHETRTTETVVIPAPAKPNEIHDYPVQGAQGSTSTTPTTRPNTTTSGTNTSTTTR